MTHIRINVKQKKPTAPPSIAANTSRTRGVAAASKPSAPAVPAMPAKAMQRGESSHDSATAQLMIATTTGTMLAIKLQTERTILYPPPKESPVQHESYQHQYKASITKKGKPIPPPHSLRIIVWYFTEPLSLAASKQLFA